MEAYGLLLPIYLYQRCDPHRGHYCDISFPLGIKLTISDYARQATCHAELRTLCDSVVEENARMFALYYRVVLYTTHGIQ